MTSLEPKAVSWKGTEEHAQGVAESTEGLVAHCSHAQGRYIEEQHCLSDPEKIPCTPKHEDAATPASSAKMKSDSGNDEEETVAENDADRLCNLVSKFQGSRMDEQRCSAPQTLQALGSPSPPRKVHSRPASPPVSAAGQGLPRSASFGNASDKETVPKDGLQSAQQGMAPNSTEQEQFFSLLSHVQRGFMEEQRCVLDPNKKGTFTPAHCDVKNSGPIHSSPADMEQLFGILASSQSRRLDDQRVSLNVLPGIQGGSRSDKDGQGKFVATNQMNELCNMVSRVQCSRMDEQRCSAPHALLAPGSPPPPRKAHSRPASPAVSPSRLGPASISLTPDTERVQRDGLQTVQQKEAPSAADQEQFFSLLSHVQRGRMEEQRCLFDPNKKSTITVKSIDATNSDPAQSSDENVDQLFRILASSQSHRLDDQRVSLSVLPGIQRVSGSDQNGVGKSVPGKEMTELCDMVSKFQCSRMDEQRCSAPHALLAPGSPPPPRKAHSRPASPAVSPSRLGPASISLTPDTERVQRDGLQTVQQKEAPSAADQEQFFSLLSHVQRGRMEEQRCLFDPNKKSTITVKSIDATNSDPAQSSDENVDQLFRILASSQSHRLDDQRVSLSVLPGIQRVSDCDQNGVGKSVPGQEMNELCDMVSKLQSSRLNEQRCSAPQILLDPRSLPPPRKPHSRPASPTVSASSQGPPGSASISPTPDKETVLRDGRQTALVEAPSAADQEQFFSLLSHVQRGRMEEQRCLFDPNRKSAFTPHHTNATNSDPTHSSPADMDQLFRILASSQSRRLDDQRVSLNVLPGIQRVSVSDQNGGGKSVPGQEMNELCNMVSKFQSSRLDEQRCSAPQLLLAPGSPPPPRKAHSRPASPAVAPSSEGPSRSATVRAYPDKDRVQKDGLQAVQQSVTPSAADQEQFFSLLSHVQRGRMEEQRCLFDPNKKSSFTPQRTDAANSDPTHSVPADMDRLFSILASSQSHRLDDQRVSLNVLPWKQGASGGHEDGSGMNELCNMVSRVQGSRMDEQRCSVPHRLLAPGSPPPPRKAHSRPASPTTSPDSQGLPRSASFSTAPDKERVQSDSLRTAQQGVAADQEQFFSLLSHVQKGRMEEQRCHFDPNKRTTSTPKHKDATNSGPTLSSTADMDQLFSILASIQSHRLNDQRVSLHVLPDGLGKSVAGKETAELCNMVSRVQGCRIDDQRCSLPMALGPGPPRSASMGAGALDFALPRHDQFLAAPNVALPSKARSNPSSPIRTTPGKERPRPNSSTQATPRKARSRPQSPSRATPRKARSRPNSPSRATPRKAQSRPNSPGRAKSRNTQSRPLSPNTVQHINDLISPNEDCFSLIHRIHTSQLYRGRGDMGEQGREKGGGGDGGKGRERKERRRRR